MKMSKKAFTLIELLVVIVILGILFALIVPSISKVVEERKQEAYQELISLFESAAELYSNNSIEDVTATIDRNGTMSVSLATLIELGYLKNNLVNPINDEKISDTKRILIAKISSSSLGFCYEDRNDCYDYFYSSTLASKIIAVLKAKNNSYYFEGANPNNWIEFGQVSSTNTTPLMWRILRSDNEGIKIIYEGAKNGSSQPTDNGAATVNGSTTVKFNTSSTNKYIGSNVEAALNNWYSSIYIANSVNYLSNIKWCISGEDNIGPTTKYEFYETECINNPNSSTGYYQGKTNNDLPYGLIKVSDYLNASSATTCVGSYDAAVVNLGGDCGRLSDGTTTNYLLKNYYWWTGIAVSNSATNAWGVTPSGFVGSDLVTADYKLRPVLNLHTAVVYNSGSGTLADPYKIRPVMASTGLILNLDANDILSYPGSGNVWYDLSGNNRNAILYNSPSYVNGTISLDGIDDYIEVTNSTDLIQGKTQFTMGLWFKLDDVSQPLRGLIGVGDYGCQRNLILTANGNDLTFYNDDTNCRSVSLGAPLPVNKWIFAIAKYDGINSFVGASINGSTISYKSDVLKTGATNVFNSNFRVMAPNHSYRTSGDVSLAFVYDRFLSNNEIENIFKTTKSRFGF